MSIEALPLDETFVTYPGADGFGIRALLCRPRNPSPLPGVVLVHEMYGLTEHISQTARRLAHEGYAVLAPDLFSRGDGPGWPPVKERIPIVGDYPDLRTTEDLERAIEVLRNAPGVDTERIACMGFSFGARYILFACARRRDVTAAVIFYPALFYRRLTENRVAQPLTSIRHIACPALFLYGEQDQMVELSEMKQLRQLASIYDQGHQYHRYPDAGHGFFNDTLKTHHPEAAADSWTRTLAFLDRHLRPPVAGDADHA